MSSCLIGEAITVQFPMVAHAAGVGWTPIPPEEARRKRGGDDSMLLRDEVEAALSRFNPWMDADVVRQVVEKLQAIAPTIDGNREMLSWLRGERQWYDEAEQRHRPVTLIDFDQLSQNVFHVTWEWRLKPPARKGNRADVMFVINGLPVCIVEHKNPKDGGAIDRGVTQLKRYEKETPELVGTPQLFNVTHLIDYWYGVTWNANRRFMAGGSRSARRPTSSPCRPFSSRRTSCAPSSTGFCSTSRTARRGSPYSVSTSVAPSIRLWRDARTGPKSAP